MSEMILIGFRDVEIAVFGEGEQRYVAITPICQALGIDDWGQRQRIQRHPVMAKGGCIMQLPSAGGLQQTFCLKLVYLHFWLATIQSNRVAAERRAELTAFQEECADVLFRYFLGNRFEVLSTAPMREWRLARRTANRQRYARRQLH